MTVVTEPTIKLGLKRAITKTVVQLVLYPVVLSWIAVLALKHRRAS
jgi:hypothetical protein